MQYQKKRMVKTIMNEDPNFFDKEFNHFVQNVLDKGYDYEIHHCDGMGKLCCQIFYTSTIEIPETLEEEHWLCGDEAHCSDCPHWATLRASDTRKQKKYFRCEHGEGLAYAEREACEWFYENGGANEG